MNGHMNYLHGPKGNRNSSNYAASTKTFAPTAKRDSQSFGISILSKTTPSQ